MKLFSKNYSHYNDEDLMRFFIKGDKKAFEGIRIVVTHDCL